MTVVQHGRNQQSLAYFMFNIMFDLVGSTVHLFSICAMHRVYARTQLIIEASRVSAGTTPGAVGSEEATAKPMSQAFFII